MVVASPLELQDSLPRAGPTAAHAHVERTADVGVDSGVSRAAVSRAVLRESSWVGGLSSDLPEFESPTGTSTLRGTCRTPQGEAVSGVLVWAYQAQRESELSYVTAAALDVGDMERWDRDLLRGLRPPLIELRRRRATMREARSDERGEFVLTGLADVPYIVGGTLAHHEVRCGGSEQGGVLPGTEISVVVVLRCTVEIDVRLPDGTQPPEAIVDVTREDSGWEVWAFAWSPREMSIELGTGTYGLEAYRGRRERPLARSAPTTVSLFGSEGGTRAVLTLERALTVCGQIRFEDLDERPRRSIAVKAVSLDGEVSDGVESNLWWCEPAALESTEDGWSYRLDFLEPGPQAVVLTEGGEILERIDVDVQVDTPLAGPEFLVPKQDLSQHLLVRVLGPEGRPYPGAVSFSWSLADNECAVVHQAVGEGTYRLARPKPEDVGSTPSFLHVHDEHYGNLFVPCRPLDQEVCDVRFARPGRLLVRIANAPESGTDDLFMMRLGRESADRTERVGVRTPAPDESFVFAPVQPGGYELFVAVHNQDWNTHDLVQRTVQVQSGEQVVELALPTLHELTVVVPRPFDPEDLPYVGLLLEDGDGTTFHQSCRVNAEGRVRFEHLPEGTYQVRVGEFDVESPMMRVRVPATSAITFAADTFLKQRAYRVTIHDPEGGLARAGLQDGDRVIGIAGSSFENRDQMNAAFRGELYRSDAPVELHVMRGTVEQRWKVDPVLLRDSDAWGGRLEPALR